MRNQMGPKGRVLGDFATKLLTPKSNENTIQEIACSQSRALAVGGRFCTIFNRPIECWLFSTAGNEKAEYPRHFWR